jgi:hypothetical protein
MKFIPKKSNYYLLITIFFFAFACKSKEVTKTNENKEITMETKLVTEKTYNQDSTYLLVLEYSQNIEVVKNFKFKVIDTSTKETVLDSSFIGTKLTWHTNTELIGYLHVGIVKEDDDSVLNNNSAKENKDSSYKIIKIKN